MFPGVRQAPWATREWAIVKVLVADYGEDVVEQGIEYLFVKWDRINVRIFKGQSSGPTLWMLQRFHDQLMVEAQRWYPHQETMREWDAWWIEHPEEQPPLDLEHRYQRAKAQLQGLS